MRGFWILVGAVALVACVPGAQADIVVGFCDATGCDYLVEVSTNTGDCGLVFMKNGLGHPPTPVLLTECLA